MRCCNCNSQMQDYEVRECPYCGAKSCSSCVKDNGGCCPYCDSKLY